MMVVTGAKANSLCAPNLLAMESPCMNNTDLYISLFASCTVDSTLAFRTRMYVTENTTAMDAAPSIRLLLLSGLLRW